MCTTQGYLIKMDYNKMEPRSQNFPTIIWGSGEAAPVLLSANALKGSGLYPTRVGRAFGESGAEKCFDCDFQMRGLEWDPLARKTIPHV